MVEELYKINDVLFILLSVISIFGKLHRSYLADL